jgi:hypothetical protein
VLCKRKLINKESLAIAPVTLKVRYMKVLIKVRLVLLATKSNAPVIGTLGGGRNALFIYPKDNIIVVILKFSGWSSQVLLKK